MAAFTKRNVGPVTIIELLGPRLTHVEGSELRGEVNELLDEGRSSILLDCAQVGFIDSQGVGFLVRTWMSAGRRGQLKLFNLTPSVREILHITGLLKVMDSFDDIGSALQSFSRHASA
jgi:anti-sigma B factor antagonist